MPFGNWLRAEIDRRGWSQADLVARADVPRGTVSRWVNNVSIPPPDYCRRIAEALGIPESVVLGKAGHGDTAAPLDRITIVGELRRLIREIDHWRSDTLMLLSEEVERVEHGIAVPVVGRVPADRIRFTEMEGLEETVRVLEEDLRGAQFPVALLVSGDCWRSMGILTGDHVIVDRAAGRQPRDRQICVVCVNGEYSLKRWCVIDRGRRIELQDGDGNVAATVSVLDEVEVYGFYVTFKPTAPRE